MTFDEYIKKLETYTDERTRLERELAKSKIPESAGIDALVEMLEKKKAETKEVEEEHTLMEKLRDTPGFDQNVIHDTFMRYCTLADSIKLLEDQIKRSTNSNRAKTRSYDITEELVEEVKEMISIPMMCKQQSIHMRRSGSDKVAIVCPFHDEDTPSCMVYVEQDSWWCFGCNQGGDSLKFYMLLTELDFIPAVEQLVERLGLVITDETQEAKREEKTEQVKKQIARLDLLILDLKREFAS